MCHKDAKTQRFNTLPLRVLQKSQDFYSLLGKKFDPKPKALSFLQIQKCPKKSRFPDRETALVVSPKAFEVRIFVGTFIVFTRKSELYFTNKIFLICLKAPALT